MTNKKEVRTLNTKNIKKKISRKKFKKNTKKTRKTMRGGSENTTFFSEMKKAADRCRISGKDIDSIDKNTLDIIKNILVNKTIFLVCFYICLVILHN